MKPARSSIVMIFFAYIILIFGILHCFRRLRVEFRLHLCVHGVEVVGIHVKSQQMGGLEYYYLIRRWERG